MSANQNTNSIIMIGYMVIQNQIQLRTSSCMVIACIYSAYQVPRPTCFWNFQKWVGEPGYYSAYQVPRPKTSINGSGNLAVATIARTRGRRRTGARWEPGQPSG